MLKQHGTGETKRLEIWGKTNVSSVVGIPFLPASPNEKVKAKVKVVNLYSASWRACARL